MELRINGESKTIKDGTTVAQLLETLKVVPEMVVIEINLDILRRNKHSHTTLKEGDQVEIVQLVAGGT